ncbi:hypothetical protein GJW-30_1_02669 [Variibacter gotjawalensis]|uniref:Outer membrane protein beta-barrel domain-containing protein n=1 Tax=Variibacter gotjawalensis TaxID=1333996 RepID=A0A0S3PW45_9BRAD|nr:outer membrane beta-barrel protein [Variibacter gotjawalensis]NIK45960.1 outer membrane immunogenic protein [Variibacter gotjawalensis]RZS47878.1 outer membrane immunogenic protein [Variibacter gotjawalensis]BAT60134.1 hypothetical protein GJW-30_1_02669 [Variibacter gotjawalensis]
MKKILTAALFAGTFLSPALAADLGRPVYKAPIAVVEPVTNWNGFYIGAHGGGAWGDSDWLFPLAAITTNHRIRGGFGGGQIGYNWQFSPMWLVGIEGEGSWGSLTGSSVCPNPAANCTSKTDWMASITGRLGYVAGNALFYFKGGYSWANEIHHVRFPATPADDETSGNLRRSGYTIGGGLEYAFAPQWSAKIEYMYTDYGRRTFDFTRINTGAFVETARVDTSIHTVKAGINYRFNWGAPVVASY